MVTSGMTVSLDKRLKLRQHRVDLGPARVGERPQRFEFGCHRGIDEIGIGKARGVRLAQRRVRPAKLRVYLAHSLEHRVLFDQRVSKLDRKSTRLNSSHSG